MHRSSTLAFARFSIQLAAAGLAALPGSAGAQQAQHDMSRMNAAVPMLPLGIPWSRLGSGTSWLPDSSTTTMLHRPLGDWLLMVDGAAFGQFDRQSTLHGGDQLGGSDWEMLMLGREAAGGVARLNLMTSFEELVSGPRGYPELLQTGGSYRGFRIANREHPNEPVMEASGSYDRALTRTLASSIYVGAVGEPALGPVAYMERPSAAPDPFAPIGHHWQDAEHESFGVVTASLYSHSVKLDGSAFNARETPTNRNAYAFPGARLDSYAARVTAMPTARAVFSAWGGYLFDHDALDPGTGMQRYGASILTSARGVGGGAWSSALVWGLNIHHHGAREHVHDPTEVVKTYHASTSVLAETTLELGARTAISGRVEQVQKSADELGFLGGDLAQQFTLRSIAMAATRDVRSVKGLAVGVGARASVALVPSTLELAYQTRTPTGFAVYVRMRPSGAQ